MNKVQKDYTAAKAAYEAEKNRLDKMEKAWLRKKGRTENFIWCITGDDELFDRLNEEYSAETKTEYENLCKLEARYRAAEDRLIEYGLSIVPKKYADILRTNKDYTIRQKQIALIMQLDTKTVPAKALAI